MNFMEIDNEIISMAILFIPAADSRRAFVSYRRQFVYKYWLTTSKD